MPAIRGQAFGRSSRLPVCADMINALEAGAASATMGIQADIHCIQLFEGKKSLPMPDWLVMTTSR